MSETFDIGVDVGGTFTDIVVRTPAGTVLEAKAATTPADQSEGVLEGLRLAAAALGLDLARLLARTGRLVHGTTVATNALLEGKGARVGMLVTEGHRDVIEMREGLKPARYDLRLPAPAPLIPRALRLPVRERMLADGSVAIPLDPASLHAALDRLAEAGVAAVAVCFLHAWRNPAHERLAAEAARLRLPDAYVTTSAEVLPQIKEFERFSTTVANAMVGPIVHEYLRRLARRLAAAGLRHPPFVMLSHGGIATVEEAVRLAAGTALSGPAGGVAAAATMAGQADGADLIAFDMGGTSTDIALIRQGAAALTSARGVGEVRIALPALDIVSLGAGGGSIAAVGTSCVLRVGPESAGARPGPACYGLGGEAATVTDANLVLGYLDAEAFLGGTRRLDAPASWSALRRLGERLGLDPVAAAAGVHRLINARMADGVRVATVRRGFDPRRFALLAFGGAAGLHATAVAAELGIVRVLVPARAAVLSAWGMLNSDLVVQQAQSFASHQGMDLPALRAAFAEMEARGRAQLAWFDGPIEVARSADLRYGEQVFEIPVPLDGIDLAAGDAQARIAAAFHRRHAALFTYAMPDQEVVLVNARLAVTGRIARTGMAAMAEPQGARVAPASSRRRVFLGDWQEVPVLPFAALAEGKPMAGPALIEAAATTVLLRPADRARFDRRNWLDITVGGQG